MGAWDQAYKEGMASKLRKRALAAQKELHAKCDTLALSLKEVQQRLVQRLGLNLQKGKKVRSLDSCEQARQRGSRDASSINLRQRQLEQNDQLALPAPAMPIDHSAQ